MSQEIIDSIIKLVADNKQALTSFDQLRDAYAKTLQDMDRRQDGHVRYSIGAYRQIADTQIQAGVAAARAKEAEHAKEVKRLNDEIALQKKAAQSRLDSLDAVDKKEKNLQLSRIGRIGAGIATMTGNYQVAGGMYAASNAAQMAGISMSAGATAAIGAGAIGLGILNYGRELNVELAKMSTLLLPASAGTVELSAAMERASESASRLSARFNVDIVDVVKAYKEALSSGIEEGDLERFGKVAGTLSKALSEDFGKTVNILTTFKDTYGSTVGELDKFGDILFNVVDVGKTDVTKLLNNFGRLMPVGKAAGIAIEDLAAAFATLSRQMSVPQATTGLLNMIRDIMNPSEKSAKAFREYGITFGQMAFEGRTLLQVVEEIKRKTGGSGEAIGKLFSDVQAQRGAVGITSVLDLYKELTPAIKNTETAIVAANRAQNTFWENLGRDYNAFSNTVKVLGSDLSNGLNWLIYGGRNAAAAMAPQNAQIYRQLYSSGVKPEMLGNGIMGSGSLKKFGIGVYGANGDSGLSADQVTEYYAFYKEQLAKEKELKDKKEKADKELSELAAQEIQAVKERISNTYKTIRSGDVSERATPEQKEKIEKLSALIERMRSKGTATIETNWLRARQGVSDESVLASANMAKTEELKKLEEGIALKQQEIYALEESILNQRLYKDVQKDEAEARKEAAKFLRVEARSKQIELERKEKEKLEKPARDAAKLSAINKERVSWGLWELTELPKGGFGVKSDTVPQLTPRQLAEKEEKALEKQLEDKEKAKAKEDALVKKILARRKKEGKSDLTSVALSADSELEKLGIKAATSTPAIIALGESAAVAANILVESALALKEVMAAIPGLVASAPTIPNLASQGVYNNLPITLNMVGNSIDSAKIANSVKNAIDRGQRNGTLKSDYQQKSKLSNTEALQTMSANDYYDWAKANK